MVMERYILFLAEIGDDDAPRVGSKALRLAQLARAGLPVPPGFCLTTTAHRTFLEAHVPSGAYPDPAALRQAGVPPEVARAVEEACAAFIPSARTFPPLAVRSSATAEDLPEASFAGQYDTILNVVAGEGRDGIAPLLAAIRGCWAAPWSKRARAYAARHGLDPRQIEMAVLIQQQIPAEAAGVLFTLNPLTGREEEMLIEAVWGLGEPLVAGEVTPD
ncbi:MAG TPA: phosphoenolpyruvate synthase, partial [Anaerolineales bacterium]|nr:phosphoenolpyruvate synthase [Anaerolineales bacterium]